VKSSLLRILRCPCCRTELELRDETIRANEVWSGTLRCRSGCEFSIRDFIPRFVDDGDESDSFGRQWNKFRLTQLDSHSGTSISRDRFFRYSGWTPAELGGDLVLDAGCGAGRFTEVALAAGAEVVAIDISSAVDACGTNFGRHPRAHVVQADIYHLPFEPGSFDRVYCFGVLQHTPDVEEAFRALPVQLKPGGTLAVDIYPRLLRNLFWSKYWVRPVTRRLPRPVLFRILQRVVPLLLSLARIVARVPGTGGRLRYLLPVVSYEGVYPLNKDQLGEWALLDTFDMLAPRHDQPQPASRLQQWLVNARLTDMRVERMGFLIGRGRKPPAS
jgi:SAM-dependent methyltransferase